MRASFATVGLVAATSALASPFQMPSGNIRCNADVHNGQPSDIVCTILERSGPSTTPPPPGCNSEWGYTFELGGRGEGGMRRTAYARLRRPGARVREDLDVWRRDLRISESGLECRNADGHGFFLSRGRQSVF